MRFLKQVFLFFLFVLNFKLMAGQNATLINPTQKTLVINNIEATQEEWKAAQAVEGLMYEMLIQEMRKTVPENDIIPVSQGEKIFRSMLDQEYARMLSESYRLGIAELVLAQMKGKR